MNGNAPSDDAVVAGIVRALADRSAWIEAGSALGRLMASGSRNAAGVPLVEVVAAMSGRDLPMLRRIATAAGFADSVFGSDGSRVSALRDAGFACGETLARIHARDAGACLAVARRLAAGERMTARELQSLLAALPAVRPAATRVGRIEAESFVGLCVDLVRDGAGLLNLYGDRAGEAAVRRFLGGHRWVDPDLVVVWPGTDMRHSIHVLAEDGRSERRIKAWFKQAFLQFRFFDHTWVFVPAGTAAAVTIERFLVELDVPRIDVCEVSPEGVRRSTTRSDPFLHAGKDGDMLEAWTDKELRTCF